MHQTAYSRLKRPDMRTQSRYHPDPAGSCNDDNSQLLTDEATSHNTTGKQNIRQNRQDSHDETTFPINHQQDAGHRARESFLSVWWAELLSTLLGIGIFCAITVVCSKYNAQEQPAWKYSISLNTLIAILSTLLRYSIVLVVEQVISQAKWAWYREPRPLRDLSDFDAAARGPWGSLYLIFRTRALNLTLLCCLIMWSSVAVGPFSQQAIRTESCDKVDPVLKSSIPVARRMTSANTPRGESGFWQLDLETSAAVINAMANPTGNRSAVSATCNTGNCTFASFDGITHSSLGVCKQCVDMSSEIHGTFELSPTDQMKAFAQLNVLRIGDWLVEDGQLDYPNIFVNITTDNFEWATPLAGTPMGGPDFQSALERSILNVTILTFTHDGCTISTEIKDGENKYNVSCSHSKLDPANFDTRFWASPSFQSMEPTAVGCTFYPCVKNFNGQVNTNVLVEDIVGEGPAKFEHVSYGGPLGYYREYFNLPCVVNGESYSFNNLTTIPTTNQLFNTTVIDGKNVSVPTQCYFAIDQIYLTALGQFLNSFLVGYCSMPPILTYPVPGADPKSIEPVSCDGWWLKSLYNKGNASFATIEANLDAVTTAITNEIRRQSTDWSGAFDAGPFLAEGTVTRTTVCTKFDSAWLAFPASLLILTVLLFAVTTVKWQFERHHVPYWKSSLLPLLFTGNGSQNKPDEREKASDRLERIEEEADRIVVTLLRRDGGWNFVGARSNEVDIRQEQSTNEIMLRSSRRTGT